MKKVIAKLWNEYLASECAEICTAEERKLIKRAAELHKKANILLNGEQKEAIDKYIDTLNDVEAIFVKKAFFKGCEFSISFLLEAGSFKL